MKTIIITLISIIFLSNYAIAQKDEEKSMAYFEQANVYFDSKNYPLAIIYCDSAIAANTDNFEAYAYRGVCKVELKLYDEAIKDFDLALILKNGYAEVYYFRGLCKMELGANQGACEDWYESYNLGYKKVMNLIKKYCQLEESPDTEEEK